MRIPQIILLLRGLAVLYITMVAGEQPFCCGKELIHTSVLVCFLNFMNDHQTAADISIPPL